MKETLYHYEIDKQEFSGIKNIGDNVFQPYVGIGVGYATANGERKDFTSFLIRPIVGLNINVFNYFYARTSMDYEFYTIGRNTIHINNHNNDKYHFSFSFMIGTYIY